jgi:hypothetical protein
MRLIFLFLLLPSILDAGEIPVLRFDDAVSWKQIFDFGFRPKYNDGLEDHMCICPNQSFWVQFKNRDQKFKIENGRVAFTFSDGDFLEMVWHQGTEAITLEEGKLRAGEFRKVFDGYIVKEITMPPLIDPSGLVDAGNAENNIEARIGEYVIWYGFDNSFGTKKPIIPHFYITWSFPGMPDTKPKDVRDVVRAPKGYEWYSLDPKVNTPDPVAALSSLSGPESKDLPQNSPLIPRKERRRNLMELQQTSAQGTPWGWWVALGTVLIAVVVWFIRKLMNRPKR